MASRDLLAIKQMQPSIDFTQSMLPTLPEVSPIVATAAEVADASPSRLFVIGAIGGALETFVQQPIVYWKTMAQVGSKMSWSPNKVYRGVMVNAGSIAPITAVQMGGYGALSQIWSSITGKSTHSNTTDLALASTAGAISAAIVGPAEMVMIYQQQTGLSLRQATSDLWHHSGFKSFFRGGSTTVARETLWTLGFMGLAPMFTKELQQDSEFFRQHDLAASLISSVVAGQIAATLSQPFDVLKTRMQSDRGMLFPKRWPTTAVCAQKLFMQEGWRGFFRGLAARSLRVCGATFIICQTQLVLERAFDRFLLED